MSFKSKIEASADNKANLARDRLKFTCQALKAVNADHNAYGNALAEEVLQKVINLKLCRVLQKNITVAL